MKNKRKLYRFVFNPDKKNVYAVSMVTKPAIKVNALKFSDEGNLFKFSQDDERMILTGPVMIPDLVVPRKIDYTDPYSEVVDCFIKKSDLEKVYENYMINEGWKENNFFHDPKIKTQGVSFMFECFLADKDRGISCPEGFEDLPDGTWFMSQKFTDREIWQDVKEHIGGYSIEAFFTMINVSSVDEEIEDNEIEEILAEINKIEDEIKKI